MSSINKYTIPQAFFDGANSKIELITPEPQYLCAQLAMAGRLSALALADGAPNVAAWVKEASGGQPSELDRLVRVAEILPDAVMVVEKKGADKGDRVRFERDVYSGGGYTEADRKVTVDVETSTTGIKVSKEDMLIDLFEFEGPFASGGSVVQPYIVRNFDTLYRQSATNLVALAVKHMKRDRMKFLNTVVQAKFLATTNITFPEGITNGASFSAGGGAEVTLDQILSVKESLSGTGNEWPSFGDGRYPCFVPTSFHRQVARDTRFVAYAKDHESKNPLFTPIGSIGNIDFYECSTLPSYAPASTYDGQTVASGVTLNEGFMFGPGAVGMGVAMDPNVFASDSTNYGKEVKLIWRSIEGFGNLDPRAVRRFVYQTA